MPEIATFGGSKRRIERRVQSWIQGRVQSWVLYLCGIVKLHIENEYKVS